MLVWAKASQLITRKVLQLLPCQYSHITYRPVQNSSAWYWKCQKQIRKHVAVTPSAPTKIYQHPSISILSLWNTQMWRNCKKNFQCLMAACPHTDSQVEQQAWEPLLYIHKLTHCISNKFFSYSVTLSHVQQHTLASKTNYLAAGNIPIFTVNMHQHFLQKQACDTYVSLLYFA